MIKAAKLNFSRFFICQYCKKLTKKKQSCEHENVFGSNLKIAH